MQQGALVFFRDRPTRPRRRGTDWTGPERRRLSLAGSADTSALPDFLTSWILKSMPPIDDLLRIDQRKPPMSIVDPVPF